MSDKTLIKVQKSNIGFLIIRLSDMKTMARFDTKDQVIQFMIDNNLTTKS